MDLGRAIETTASQTRTSSVPYHILSHAGARKDPCELSSVHQLPLLISSCQPIARWRFAYVVRHGTHTMGLAAAQLLRYLVVLRLATGVYHAMRDYVTELTWTSNASQKGDTVLELNCSGLGQAA